MLFCNSRISLSLIKASILPLTTEKFVSFAWKRFSVASLAKMFISF
nr:MAG TPA: hypothetical protein [Caudoviricetes sp.]